MMETNAKFLTLSIRPSTGGVRKFAVTTSDAIVSADWYDNPLIQSQSDQMWHVRIWQRIEDRGYVARVEGDGQWSNLGDHGVYIGTGATAEAAFAAAWRSRVNDDDYEVDAPRSLTAACRDYDAQAHPPTVE